MIRVVLLGFLIVLFLGIGVASALDLAQSRPVVRIAASGYVVLDSTSVSTPYLLPKAYTIKAVDASDDIWIRRKIDGTWENVYGIKIPAGESLLIPAPRSSVNAAGTHLVHLVYFGALADSAYAIPWD